MSEKRKENENTTTKEEEPNKQVKKEEEDVDFVLDLKYAAGFVIIAHQMGWRRTEIRDGKIRVHQLIYDLLKKMIETEPDIFSELGSADNALNLAFQSYRLESSLAQYATIIEYTHLMYYIMLPFMDKRGRYKLTLEGPQLPVEVIPQTMRQMQQENEESREQANASTKLLISMAKCKRNK